MKSILATIVALGLLSGAASANTLAKDLFSGAEATSKNVNWADVDSTAKNSPFFDQIDRDMKNSPFFDQIDRDMKRSPVDEK